MGGPSFQQSLGGAPSTPANTCVLLGDSLTLRNNPSDGGLVSGDFRASPTNDTIDATYTLFEYNGWFHWANAFLSQRFKVLAYSGVSGDTYASMDARVASDVVAYAPKYCFVQSSANGVALGVSAATELVSFKSIIGKLLAAGIIPIVSKMGFTASAAGSEIDEWQDFNSQAMQWLRTQNVITIDLQVGMGDPTTPPRLQAVYANGDPHPSTAGAMRMGYNCYLQLKDLVPNIFNAPSINTDYLTAFLNPLNLGSNAVAAAGGVSGNVGDNWTLSGTPSSTETCVAAKVARTDGEAGEWTSLTFAGAGGDTSESFQLQTDAVTNANSGFATGDLVTMYVEFMITTAVVNIGPPNMRWFFNGGATLVGEFEKSAFDYDAIIGVPFIMKMPSVILGTQISTNTAVINLELGPNSAAAISGVLNVGRAWFEKVTD